jgi:hypothetical protein
MFLLYRTTPYSTFGQGAVDETSFRLWLALGVPGGSLHAGPQRQEAAVPRAGVKYTAEGKHNEAILQFKNALQIDPKFAGRAGAGPGLPGEILERRCRA